MRVEDVTIDEQVEFDGLPFPLVLSPADSANTGGDASFHDWLDREADGLRERLMAHGAILFRGFPVHDAEAFEAMLDVARFKEMPYVGGAAPRTAVTQRRILTTNDSPPSEPIPFHHEMSQVPNPPAYIFFYCHEPAPEGGATAIIPSHHVLRRFRAFDPSFAQRVESHGVRYRRVMPDQDDSSSAIGRSWRSTFLTESRETAEAKMSEAGMRWEWLDSGDLWTETATLPAVRLDARTGKSTFFNSMVAAYTGWTDSRNDPTRAVVLGDGGPVKGDILEKTAQVMASDCVAFKWQAGDVLWIDNALVLHSRQPFSGPRKVYAAISPS